MSNDSNSVSQSRDSPDLTANRRKGFSDDPRSPSGSEYAEDNAEDEAYAYYSDRRHEYLLPVSNNQSNKTGSSQEWRMRERLKTVSVSLVMCLNIGVDPPDVIKPTPCARMECWIDPFSLPGQKALEAIGRNLQQQYEVWQPRARYRLSLDPSIEETKKLCCSLRRNAKDERILFHYNGHGVPKPTAGGEIWVFNKNYTQYIPVSVYDIQTWLGSPSIFVYDCSNAGNVLQAFDKFAVQRDWEMAKQHPELLREPLAADHMPTGPNSLNGSTISSASYTPLRECIQLAACQANELLPTSPDLPADLFTCCLTTPIEIALRWFLLQSDMSHKVTPNMIMKLPGKLSDRRTPLGELNWIFTAITDTIAWNVLPSHMFQRLFRQDLMVAALFRNFLLADRIMRFYKCHPMSSPVLPETHRHPMWDSWDLATDQCLRQLPALLANETSDKKVEYKFSAFFAEQLTAFDVWLRKGPISRSPPPQLPIVLQVLLSQVHRLRALMLLSKFLDLGRWAVNLALSVGIFPYVLRLLQSPAAELKPVLVFIWAKILAVDPSCQSDLVKDNGYTYFINILSCENNNMPIMSNISEHRAMCAFILSVFCHNFRFGQQYCLKSDLLAAVMPHLNDRDHLLRQWACVCLKELWKDYGDAKWAAMSRNVHESLGALLVDPVVEVRAAALAALGSLYGDLEKSDEVVQIHNKMAMLILKSYSDASPLVRLELVVALSQLAQEYPNKFVNAAFEILEEDRKKVTMTLDERRLTGSRSGGELNAFASISDRMRADMLLKGSMQGSLYTCVWKALLNLSVDPMTSIANASCSVLDNIHKRLLNSPFMESPSLSQRSGASVNIESSAGELNQGAYTANMSPNRSIQGPTPRSSNNIPITASATNATISNSPQLRRSLLAERPRPLSYMGSNASTPVLSRPPSVVVSSLRSLAGLMIGSYGTTTDLPSTANYLPSSSSRQTLSSAFAPIVQTPAIVITRKPRQISDQEKKPLHVPSFVKANEPTSETPLHHNSSDNIIGVAEEVDSSDADKVALQSTFYEWSCDYFSEPQMRVPDIDDPGSVKYIERKWRQDRNEKIIEETEARYPYASLNKFEEFVVSIPVEDAEQVLFHSFEPTVITTHGDTISVHNWETSSKSCVFTNDNPNSSQITSVQFINEDDSALLLAGTNDGYVRMYRNFDSTDIELVSAWRGLSDLIPNPKNSKLVCKWQQSSGFLFMGGTSNVIRLWDAEEELIVQEIPTKSTSFVTDLSFDATSAMIIAGFLDGEVKLYDRRISTKNCVVATFVESESPVQQVCYVGQQFQEFIVGTLNGDVLLWDIRQRARTLKIDSRIQDGQMSGFSVHDRGLLVACGSNTQNIKVMNMMGEIIGNIKHNDGFLQRQPWIVNSLTFHPRQLLLAVNTPSLLSIYSSSKTSISA